MATSGAPTASDAPQATHQSQARVVSLNRLEIRAMNNAHASLSFGRMDSDYRNVDFTVQIENQNSLSAATYQAISSAVTINLDITQAQFTQMWKTIILKRVQDVYEAEKFQRPAGFVRLGRQLPLPGPLADLCHSLGYQHSNVTGHNYHIVPPPAPVQPEPWRQVDNEILNLWNREMNRVSPLYTMKEFPSLSQCADRPLCLTQINIDQQQMAIVKAWTNEPKATDAFVRMANDDLFQAHQYITYNNCSLTMTQNVSLAGFRANYAGSYINNVTS